VQALVQRAATLVRYVQDGSLPNDAVVKIVDK
jgi:hypothetical protein